MIVVGLTGGIGSGKTTVCKYFEELEVPIYYADIEAKKLMNTSKIIKRKLIAYFGNEVYLLGKLNRPFLANLIFNNKTHLDFVNSVVHPKVNQHFKRWVNKKKRLNKKYVIQENAILFENNSYKLFDKLITVTAPLETKIARVITRDLTTRDKVLERMNNQWSDEQKIALSDYVIVNLDLSKTKSQVLKIHQNLIL